MRIIGSDEGIMMVWLAVGAVIAIAIILLVVAERQEAAYRRRTGKGRKSKRSPGESYLPPPFFGG